MARIPSVRVNGLVRNQEFQARSQVSQQAYCFCGGVRVQLGHEMKQQRSVGRAE